MASEIFPDGVYDGEIIQDESLNPLSSYPVRVIRVKIREVVLEKSYPEDIASDATLRPYDTLRASLRRTDLVGCRVRVSLVQLLDRSTAYPFTRYNAITDIRVEQESA